MAQDTSDADYVAAKAAITEGTYRIKTTVNGTDYYVTTNGGLTSVKNNAGFFDITQTSGGYFGTGFRIDGGGTRFTNSPKNGDYAVLNVTNFATSTGDRTDWERQILYLNSDGKYAIRTCNVADGTGWNDCGKTHWTYSADGAVTAQYTYDRVYIWEFEGPLTTINVTYKLVESNGTTVVSSTTKKQEANSDISTSAIHSLTGIDFNGFWHEKFYFDYDISGTIGDTDCTITITRTEKPGVVKGLSDLSNYKAYNIGCDRGAMIAYDGKMVNTALAAAADVRPYGKFALLNYEGNYYIFSIDENKFVKNDASVALDLTTVGFSTEDAMVMVPQNDNAPYFLWHFNADNKYLNTNGNTPLGYVINNYSTPDPGNLYYMIAVDDFDPSAALAELEAYFHPQNFATYIVKDEMGKTIFTSEPQPVKVGAKITTLLDEFKRPYYTYNDVDVTISEENTNIEFTATWTGPFEISTDFATAHWYNMAVRGNWYVTSSNKDNDGALKTVEANAIGLVEDAYQWAFIGNPYAGFKVFNKAEGDSKIYAWVSNDNGSIPAFGDAASANVWTIKPSTAEGYTNAFMLTTDKGFQTNQFQGAGGPLKIWNSTGTGDGGSAFTVFDVPTNFASFLVAEGIPAYFEPTGYFTLTDEAKTALGWDPAYKTDCPFEAYKNLKEKIAAFDLSDLSQFVLPETGYYLLKNKNYGTYMGIDPSDANMYGNYNTAVAAKQIVKLTKTGDATYTIGLMGKFAPASVAKSAQVTATADAANYTVVIPTVGYAAFRANSNEVYSCLHCDRSGAIVGWEAAAAASQWEVIDAESIEFTIGAEGYATAYLPFPAEFGGTIPLPEPKGVWTFDDTNDLLAGTGIATLKATTHAKDNVTETDLATAGITTVDGPYEGNGAVNIPVGSSLLMSANTNATNIGTYTIMYDVCVEDGSTFVPLLQNSLTDGKDGSLFINKNQVGLGGGLGYHGSIENNKWYRIVFAVQPNGASLYVDGVQLASNLNLPNPYNKHWLLTTGALFFADEDGEENAIKTSEVRFWDTVLSADQIADLGSVTGDAPKFPEAVGSWTFDDATDPYATTGTATLSEVGSATITATDGEVTVPKNAGLELKTNLDNIPSAYTLLLDVKLADVSGFIALFQNDITNSKDASIFINGGKIGLGSAGLGYNGTINPNTWYRIVTVINDGYCTLYVDGEQVGKSTSKDVNAWTMRDTKELMLFTDDSGEEKEVTTSEVRFWNTALTASQIAQLGTAGTTIDDENDKPGFEEPTAYTAVIGEAGSKKWLTLNKVEGTIPTKTAVVIKGTPKTYLYKIAAETAPVDNNDLKGTLEPIEATGKYILAKPQGKEVGFYLAESGSIAACKAYIELPGNTGVKALLFNAEDETAISNVNANGNGNNAAIYNMAGQRISKLQKGVNIVNGKKILK